MKKVIIGLFILSIIYIYTNRGDVIIPNESIRFRIIANSNSLEDQLFKNNIKNELKDEVIPNILSNSINNTRDNIINNISLIEDSLNKYDIKYNINYGNNYFPNKIYNGVKYKEGYYESLVITLGDGVGDNFWCVLYPPLCLVEENEYNNIEYKSIIGEILNIYGI